MSKQVTQIAEGFLNLALSTIRDEEHTVEAEAVRKLSICDTCEQRKNMKCGICGCLLSALVRSSKECPLGKHEEKTIDDR